LEASRIITIDCLDDPRLDVYRNLRTSNRGGEQATFIAEGRFVVERLLHSYHQVDSVLLGVQPEVCLPNDWLREQPLAAATKVFRVDGQQLRSLVGFDFHRGVLACGRRPTLERAEPTNLPPAGSIVLALCDLADAENIGSVVRTATAMGVSGILLSDRCADPFSRRALRVSMASVLQQRFWTCDSMETELRRWSTELDCQIVVTTLGEGAISLPELTQQAADGRHLKDRTTVVVVGNEGHGLPQAIERLADLRLTIPMQPQADSLNVGVATGIVLYALTQAKW